MEMRFYDEDCHSCEDCVWGCVLDYDEDCVEDYLVEDFYGNLTFEDFALDFFFLGS